MARSQFVCALRRSGDSIKMQLHAQARKCARIWLSVLLYPTTRLEPQPRHVLEFQFLFDPGPVGIDGSRSEPQFFSDLAGGQAASEEAKNFQPAVREPRRRF